METANRLMAAKWATTPTIISRWNTSWYEQEDHGVVQPAHTTPGRPGPGDAVVQRAHPEQCRD